MPTSFHGWLIEPTVLQKEHHARRKRGGPRRFPRLAAQSARAKPVERLCRYSPPMRDQPWPEFHVKEGAKGPIVWRAKAARFRISQRVEGASHAHTLPSAPHWLVMAENPHSGEVKYFVSNAPAGVPVETVLHGAFARWHIDAASRTKRASWAWTPSSAGGTPRSAATSCSARSRTCSWRRTARYWRRRGKKDLTLPQLRRAVDTALAVRDASRLRRRQVLEQMAQRIEARQRRGRAAYRSHRRRRLDELRELGIDPEQCRCCIPPPNR